MIDHTAAPRVSSWYSLDGPDRDVVIVSQASLNRNIAHIPFSHLLDRAGTLSLRRRVEGVFHHLSGEYVLLDGESMKPSLREFYEDRGMLVSGDSPGYSAVSSDGTVLLRLGTSDHLRLSGFAGGLDLETAQTRVVGLDEELEGHLEYAVSLKLGYLSPDIQRVGTGVMATTLLHLPALEHSEGLNIPEEKGSQRVSINRYGGMVDRNSSLYAVAHIALFGESEGETVTELEDFTRRLVHYEREARKVLLSRHGDELADTTLRALGTLRYARSFSADEATELLSTVRLGVALELIGEVSLSDITDALFVCRESQVATLEMKDDTVSTEAARAALIRNILGRKENV